MAWLKRLTCDACQRALTPYSGPKYRLVKPVLEDVKYRGRWVVIY